MTKVVPQLIKLVIFLIITAVITYVLGATISNQSYGESAIYKARFTDVTGLNEGDDVRIAGVRVGTIDSIELVKRANGADRSVADVSFTVDKAQTLPKTAEATLRYRNLVGQRYLDVERGASDSPQKLKAGDTIPLSQTHPAVDLTVLFQGFQPLTQGLDAGTLNQLSYEIIQTLQGEAGSFETLLANLADLTNALADKDQVIGSVVDNLSSVLDAVGQRDTQLSQLIIQLQRFVSGLSKDRVTIGNAIDGVNRLADDTSGLLAQVRKPLANDVVQLNGLVANLNKNEKTTQFILTQLPPTVAGLIRTASYGSWFNFYLCQVQGQISIGQLNLQIPTTNVGTGSRCG